MPASGAGLARAGRCDRGHRRDQRGGFAVWIDRLIDLPGSSGAAAPIPGRWFLGGAMNATGKALDWLREDVLRGTLTTEELQSRGGRRPPAPTAWCSRPYLSGCSDRRSGTGRRAGRSSGLTPGAYRSRVHLARAVIWRWKKCNDPASEGRVKPSLRNPAGIPVMSWVLLAALARDAGWNRVSG